MLLARVMLGIDWRVEGREHLPARPAVILSKHQSAWETMAFQLIFPPQVHVLKRELLWIPFFGWGLALMSPIAIDRSRGVAALRSIARRGRERLEQGFWVVVFPEGTRVAPGERRDYQLGGAWLAAARRRAGRAGRAQRGPGLAAQRLPQAPGHGHRAHRAADRSREPRPEDAQRPG